jgi:hypothetical protein
MDPLDEYDPETGESRAHRWQHEHRKRAVQRDFDIDRTPTVAKGDPSATFVAAAPLARRDAAVMPAPSWLDKGPQMALDGAWESKSGAHEYTSAMDRARALCVRLLPFVGLWALLGVIVGIVVLYVAQNAPGAALGGLLVFTALTAGTYVKLNGQDYAHSREGTERHRVDSAVYLAERQMDNEHVLRKMALEAYLGTIERNEGKL